MTGKRVYTKTEWTNKKAIYKIINKTNEKFYIGSSINLGKRIWQHKKELKLGIHCNPHLQNSYNVNGINAFEYEVLEFISDDSSLDYVQQLEQNYLDRYYDGCVNCYNMAKIADRPDNDLKKLKVNQIDKRTGIVIKEWSSVEEAMDACNVQGISLACKGKRASVGGYKWKYADSTLAGKFPENNRPQGGKIKRKVAEIDKNGRIIGEWNSLSSAEKETKIPYPNILGVCAGRNHSCSGRFFRYIETEATTSSGNLIVINNKEHACLECSSVGDVVQISFDSIRMLATHIQVYHKMKSEDYVIKHFYAGNLPNCLEPSCENTPRYVTMNGTESYKKWCSAHASMACAKGGSKGGSVSKKKVIISLPEEQILSVFDKERYSNPTTLSYSSELSKISIDTFKGSYKLTGKYINALSSEEKEKLADCLFTFYRSSGFPHIVISDKNLIDNWKELITNNTSIIETKIGAATYLKNKALVGNKLIHHFNSEYFYSVEGNGGKTKSMITAWNSDEILKKVIRNRIQITFDEEFNIHGAMLRQGFRSTRACSVVSNFNCMIAKYIYDHYSSSENAVVFDMSMGFGHRMLGAMASSNKNLTYVCTDPWIELVNSNKRMASFIGCEDRIKAYACGSEELFNVYPDDEYLKSIEGKVSLAFSSPPYWNKENYANMSGLGKTYEEFINVWWKKTLDNHRRLLNPETGVLVLNMVEPMIDDLVKKALENGFCENQSERIYMEMSKSHMNKKKNSGDNFKKEPFVFLRVKPS